MENNMADRVITSSSYAGGAFSILSAMTLTDFGIVAGIVTALLTFAFNVYWGWRRDRREQQIHDLAISGRIDRREPL